MAKDYLTIPATSVAAERIFSSASDLITQDRVCLAANTIYTVMCLKYWYHSTIYNWYFI